MTEDRHQRLEALFLECVALPEGQRASFLDRACAVDAALRAQVERLLARDSASEGTSIAPVVTVPPPSPPSPTIGPYRLLEKLGEGGFGEVYAAEQTAPVQRRVALKLLRDGLDSRAVLARFAAERQALALMSHPGIARVFDAGEANGRPYVVMELVEGEPITTYCEGHALPVRDRVRLVVAVCRAIEHAHQKGIIHRDLKPSNLLVMEVDGRPVVRVIDFGIAKASHGALGPGTVTMAGEFLGTPEYASPEQVDSGGADVDTRSDVYSLGVVLYRLLAGRLPFDADRSRGMVEIARRLRESDPPRPSDVAGAGARMLRGDLDWIALRALERDRERRYATAAALGDDLERYLRDEAVLAGPPGAGYRLRKFAKRHLPLVAGAAAVLIVLGGGIATTSWQAARARHESEVSGAVNDFLTRMIAGANPEANPAGREVTVRHMVDRAVSALEREPPRLPQVEAGVRHAIGSTYMGLGLYPEAESQLARAAILRSRGGAGTREVVESQLALIELGVRRGAYSSADSLLDLLAPFERSMAAHPPVWFRYLCLRGSANGNLSRYLEADSLFGLAVGYARVQPSVGADALATALGELALIRNRRGEFADAAALGREALGIVRARHPGADHRVATAVANLAVILQDAGQFAPAETLYREALALDRAVLGARHPVVAERLSTVASVLVEQGRAAEAESLHREAIGLLQSSLGEQHPTLATARGQLATLLQARGAHEEALALRRSVLTANRRHFGDGHEETANAYNNLGSALRLLGRHREAVEQFRRAIPIFERLYGPVHGTVGVATHNLGKTLLDAGRTAEAERALRDAVSIGRQSFPDGHVNVAIFESTLARALMALGAYEEAARILVPASERISAALGVDHPRSKEVAADLARLNERRVAQGTIR